MIQNFIHRQIQKYAASKKGKKYHLSFDYWHKLIWFRIAKCATRSIDEVLHIYPEYEYRPRGNYFPWLYRYYFKFTFIRNPIDRLKSCYLDKVVAEVPFQSRYHTFYRERYFPKMDINTFIEYVSVKDLNSPYTDEHIRSQVSMLNLPDIDFIGRVENFETDFRTVLKVAGIPVANIPHINKSKGELELTSVQESKIKKMYRKDYELWEDDRR